MGNSKYYGRGDLLVTILTFLAIYLYFGVGAYRDAFFIIGLIVLVQLGYIFDMLRRIYREGR